METRPETRDLGEPLSIDCETMEILFECIRHCDPIPPLLWAAFHAHLMRCETCRSKCEKPSGWNPEA